MATYSYGPPKPAGKPIRQRTTGAPKPAKPAKPAEPGYAGDVRRVNTNHQPATRPQPSGYNAAPITDGSSITNQGLGRLTDAAVGQKYGYADEQQRQAYGQSDAMMQAIPGWYDDYLRTVSNLNFADAAAWQGATNQITNLGGTMANAAAKAAGADQSAMQQDAAIRGATVDPQAAVRAQQAASLNTQALGDQAALMTNLGANSGSYFRRQYGIGARDKVGALEREVGYRRNKLDPEAAQLAREKGDFQTTYRQDYTNDEAKRVLERQIFGADQTAAATKAQGDAVKANADMAAKTGYTVEEWLNLTPEQRVKALKGLKSKPRAKSDEPYKFGYTKKEWMALPLSERKRITAENDKSGNGKPKRPASGPGSLTSSAETKLVSQVETIANVMHGGVWHTGPGRGQPATIAQLKRHFALNGTDPRVLRLAESLARNNMTAIGPYGVEQAHKLGLHVGGRWKVVRPKKAGG